MLINFYCAIIKQRINYNHLIGSQQWIKFYVTMFVTTSLICLKIVKYMKLKVANKLLHFFWLVLYYCSVCWFIHRALFLLYKMFFNFYFLVFKFSNVLPVNTESLFKLSSDSSNIFLIATATDNSRYQLGSFAVQIWFQNKWLVPIRKLKEFNLDNIIATKASFYGFCCFQN